MKHLKIKIAEIEMHATEDGKVIFTDATSEQSVATTLGALLYLVQRFQEDVGGIPVTIIPSEWRGVYGVPE